MRKLAGEQMMRKNNRTGKRLRLTPLILGGYAAFLGFGLIVIGLTEMKEGIGIVRLLIGLGMAGFGLLGLWDGVRDLIKPDKKSEQVPVSQFILTDTLNNTEEAAKGKSEADIYQKIIRRGITLVLLGCVYNGLLQFDFANLRCASVLARIGLGWMFAALLFVRFRISVRVWIAGAILIGYWVWMAFIPVPGVEAGAFTLEGNWVGYVDRLLLPGRLHQGIFDPEGLLSTLPGIVTAMLGMFTGEFVKLRKEGLTDNRKVAVLLLAGMLLMLVGLLWSLVFPINKKLWSSSFVCVVGAYSVWMFALFYYIVDVLEWRKWTFFFQVIGVNSITIYLAQKFINFSYTSQSLFGGLIGWMPETAQPFASTIGYIAVCWGFLYFLYRQRIFLKV